MSTSIKHNTFINYDTYKTYKEDSIGWFNYIILTVSLQKTTRLRLEKTSDRCLHDRGKNKITNKGNENDSNNAVIIPAFDINSKKI